MSLEKHRKDFHLQKKLRKEKNSAKRNIKKNETAQIISNEFSKQ